MSLNKKYLTAFLIVALIFFLIEARGLFNIAPGDENVYYYMAKSVAEGQVPYKDFFYAHPPLHIIVLSLIIKVFGVNFAALKSATLLSLLTASFFLYLTSIELFKNHLNDNNALILSVLSVVLFLFSFEVLFKATFSMGINFSLMFVMISFYLILTKRYFVGGIFAGLAGLTRFYTLAPIIPIFLFVLLKKFQEKGLRDFLHMLLGFLCTFGIAVAVLYLAFGQKFTEPVFSYHLLKPKLPNQRIIVYKNILTENWVLFVAFLSSFFMKNKKSFQIFFFTAIGYPLFLLSLNAPAEFYFSIGFPFMAIIGSYAAVDLARRINAKRTRYLLIIFILLVFLWNAAADVLFLEKIGFLEFSPLNQLVSKILLSNPSQKIFGDDSVVPLLGLMANRSIALNFIDSNEMRFTSGLANFYLFSDELNKVNISYIVLRKNRGLHQITEFKQYAGKRCSLEKIYSDIAEGDFLVYKCF